MNVVDTMTAVREFILDRFLAGEDPGRLTASTPLITGGLIDSLGMLQLVAFLEERLGLEFEARELDRDRLDTLDAIERLVRERLARGR